MRHQASFFGEIELIPDLPQPLVHRVRGPFYVRVARYIAVFIADP